MIREVSAGGLIFCNSIRGLRLLVMKDRKGLWTFPKGKIEQGEDLQTTAVREIAEEVGMHNLTLAGALPPASYWYFRRLPIRKTVHYYVFLSTTAQTPVVQTEEGITEAKWISVDDAKTLLGYPKTNMPLLTEAVAMLTSAT